MHTNIYGSATKMHKAMETESAGIKHFLKNPRLKDLHWLHHRCYMDEHNLCVHQYH